MPVLITICPIPLATITRQYFLRLLKSISRPAMNSSRMMPSSVKISVTSWGMWNCSRINPAKSPTAMKAIMADCLMKRKRMASTAARPISPPKISTACSMCSPQDLLGQPGGAHCVQIRRPVEDQRHLPPITERFEDVGTILLEHDLRGAPRLGPSAVVVQHQGAGAIAHVQPDLSVRQGLGGLGARAAQFTGRSAFPSLPSSCPLPFSFCQIDTRTRRNLLFSPTDFLKTNDVLPPAAISCTW